MWQKTVPGILTVIIHIYQNTGLRKIPRINMPGVILQKEGQYLTFTERDHLYASDNLSLAFTVPQKIINRARISNLKFNGTIRNLGYWAPRVEFLGS
jgi:hypothetical protein